MQVAARNKRLFMQSRAVGYVTRQELQQVTFHVDIPNTVMVNAVGKGVGANWSRTSGLPLRPTMCSARSARRRQNVFFAANQGNLIGDELIATDVTDFSPYLLKLRQAKPDVVCCNLPAIRSRT